MRLAAAAAIAASAVGLIVAAPATSQGTEGTVPPVSEPDPAATFELQRARAKPADAFYYARREPALNYRFRASGPLDVALEIVKGRDGKIVRRWVEPRARPGVKLTRTWNGLNERGRVVPDGKYSFRLAPAGERAKRVESISFHGYRFPIPGPHSYREGEGDFGVPRNGGRVHEGKDVWAACGRTLIAARGGRVARTGYDGRLFGHYVVIDGRGTSIDHFYVHLNSAPSVREGERVHTGERIGAVGRSGNAASIGCQLHFEVWPQGFRRGNPVDPEPSLRAWDGWS
ncbi:MAG: peptidoglycan DD-metalloendopeptidase family protein [Solirubrobacterales bacterium]